MNVLLIRPPDPLQHVSLLSHTKPMNLAYLAAYLRQKGHNIAIADYEIDPFTEEAFFRLLKDFSPTVIGVSCMTPSIKNGARICSIVKNYNKDIVTVVGGPHANGAPVETMHEFSVFDYLVYGEGEVTFAELCSRINSQADAYDVAGIVLRQKQEIIKTPRRDLIADLDIIPFPARDLINFSLQSGHSTRGFSNRIVSAELFTSRGCPFCCTYCAIQTTFGRTVRFRDPSFIEEEVRQIICDYHVNHIVIADDTFTLSPARALAICDILKRNGISSWNCDTRVSGLSREILKNMKDSGCRKVAFGVESGSQRIIDLIGKKISIEQVRDAVMWAKEAGIQNIEGNFIIGSDPSETIADIELTRKAIVSLPWTFVSVAIIVPYPGTPVHHAMSSKGLIEKNVNWEDYVMFGAPPRWRTKHFGPDELVKLQKQLTRQFYLNPSYIFGRLMSIRSWDDCRYYFSAGMAFLKWFLSGKL